MNTIYDIAIAGGGTAGMTAAIYSSRAGKRVLLIEKSVYVGQIISSPEVENYPAFSPSTGYDFAAELHSQVSDLDVEQLNEEVTGIEQDDNEISRCLIVKCSENSYRARCVIIASGTVSRNLDLPGEDKYFGRGISFCAVCDGAFHKGKTVAVVGGGNTALEEALYLSFLCEKVYLIYRHSSLSAEETLIIDAQKKRNIVLMPETEIVKLHGKDELEKIGLISSGRSLELEISGLFVAIGRIPQNQIFADLLDLDNEGYIIAEDNCHTSIPGIFAAGDCRTKDLRQLVTAAADGARASSEALKYLQKNIEPQ